MSNRSVWRIWLTVSALILLACPPGRAADQPSADKDLRLGPLRVGKILFLGNSITLHPPAKNIGWLGNWGMAASAIEKDYVHLLTARIAEAAGGQPAIMVKNIADFERNFDTYDLAVGLNDELAFQPDLVFVAIGENVPPLATPDAQAKYLAAFSRLLAVLDKHGRPALVVRSSFWADGAKDAAMKQVCQKSGGVFVDIGGLDKDAANFARAERKFEHEGVAGHPGDKGMQAIADALWAALKVGTETDKP